jgi:hypothetical protein
MQGSKMFRLRKRPRGDLVGTTSTSSLIKPVLLQKKIIGDDVEVVPTSLDEKVQGLG